MSSGSSTEELTEYSTRTVGCTRYRVFLILLFLIACSASIGVVIGWFSYHGADPVVVCDGVCLGNDVPKKIVEDATEGITKKILELMNADNIRNNLQNFTKYPHLAGTEGEDQLGDLVYNMWVEQGLDHVAKDTFNILLSYPNTSDPNYVYLFNEAGQLQYKTQAAEKILRPDQNVSNVVPPFNAYSPPGHVTAPLVYVNYGTINDFELLNNTFNVSVHGCLAIIRYGKIFRADKVNLAAQFGAVGVILYSDPADYAPDPSQPTYPDSWQMPPTGVQRGTVLRGGIGDPLTPAYPSTDYAYRINEKSASLPLIPVHPISYGDAYHFLSKLGGADAPEKWRGGLNITYKLGPGFDSNHSGWNATLHVATYNERRNTTAVIGYIKGIVEPDRYVLLGNHRDAWAFGAVDPNSGTAVMMEVSRVLMSIVKEGWRPRRTIVFCSWGTEEHGVLGSYEWVEKYIKNLLDRAVVYLNVDLAIEGWQTMRARAVPILSELLFTAAKKIPSANSVSKSLYDEWLLYKPDKRNKTKPAILQLGAGSDYAGFIGIAGVPSLDVRYSHNFSISSYPLYHSAYESFYLVSEIMDKGLKHCLAMGQLWAELARFTADSLAIPLSAPAYADGLQQFVDDLNSGYGKLMRNNNVSLDLLNFTTAMFAKAANDFAARLDAVNRHNPIETRMYNDQLMRLERAFLDPEGLPLGRRLHKHILFAPSAFDSYSGSTFPGLVDLMWKIEKLSDADREKQWDAVRRHLAAIVYAINSAIYVLKPVTMFN